MLRSTLLWLSRNKTVRTITTRWGVARRAARRFVAGETIDDAIAAIRELNAQGIAATLDHLGENVETLDDARRATDDYVQVLDAIGISGLQSHVSVKLTALGLDLGDNVCRANVARIVAKAKEVGTRVRIDMESTEYTDRTLAIYRDLCREYDNVGIVIQSYLYRSEADIVALCQAGAHVRLCKGAYKEPPVHAFPKKADVDASYVRLMKMLLSATARARGTRGALATHDEKMIDATRQYAADELVPRDEFEFQMLNGIRRDLQQELAADGYAVRVYVPYGTEETFINPQWNPLDPDVTMKDYKEVYNANKDRKDSIVNITRDYTKRRSINFTNVKKNKGKGKTKAHIYDIENFSLSYAYSEIYRTSFLIEADSTINYRGGIAYNFNNNPKNYKPLSKVNFLKNDVFKIISDFNFNLMPSRIGVRTDFDRMYNVNKPRNTTPNSDIIILRNYNKSFTNVRNFDFKYDLSKAISFDFTATTNARIDEVAGKRWKDFKGPDDADTVKIIRDSLNTNLKNFGRMTNYHQTSNLNWNVPINKLPFLNWVTATAKYSGNYDWIAATPAPAEFNLGNTISNSNNKQVNGNINMVTLYNRIPYFKKVISGKKTPSKAADKKDDKGKATDKKPDDKNQKAKEDTTNKDNKFVEALARLAMTFRTGSVSYTETRGTSLPGFLPTAKYLGMDDNSEGFKNAPGTGFVFGQQDPGFLATARENGWITSNQNLNTSFSNSESKNFTARVNLEPAKDFKVELNATKSSSLNKSGIYRYSPTDIEADEYGFITQSPMETGNYSVSIITWKTAFKKFDKQTYASETFDELRGNLKGISELLGTTPGNYSEGIDSGGFYNGYGPTSQEVLIPAFIAAYTGKSISETGTSAFPAIPLPNWRITYDGLTKIEKIKKHFKSFTLSHAYRSTYNVGSFTTNQFYKDSVGNGFTGRRDLNDNFRPQKEIQVVTISEQFAPFLLVDMTWASSLITKVELKRERNLSMSLTNAQLTEMRTNEIVTGVGYRFKDVVPPFAKRFKFKVKSDLNLRADVSFRRNQTLIRKVVENLTQPTAGQNVISVKVSADYIINEKLNIRIFYDRIITTPLVSTTFPTSNTNSGISLRFTIAQ